MKKQQIYKFLNEHPIFQLATCEGNVPRVRHMMLFRADENGILFHTGLDKAVCEEILENNQVELCFLDIDSFTQIRICGNAQVTLDETLKREIIDHPTREYLKRLKKNTNSFVFFKKLIVFNVVNAKASVWSIEQNYDETKYVAKDYIDL